MAAQEDIAKENVADEVAKKAPSSELFLMAEIEIPSNETWAREFKEFEFSPEQERELKDTINDISVAIVKYNNQAKELGPRSERKRRLLAVEKSLRDVLFYLERFEDDIDNLLPFETRAQVGLLSDFLTAENILGDKTHSRRVNRLLEQAVFHKCSIDIGKIDEKLRPSRESIGLHAGGKILLNFIQKIHGSLREWVELDRLNKGGAPTNKTVRFIVYQLACSAPNILGAPAAIRKDGPFVKLCSAVMRACGMPDAADNVGNIVPKVVKQLRAGSSRGENRPSKKGE